MKLNLEAKNKQEELVLAYLQENASEMLANKINNGTPFEKDGKPLTNKKTLSGFMKYACDEARKLAEKGANSACVEDSVVYGWAMHYFEEDSIEGTLYTLDGEEYKPAPKKVTPTKTATVKPQPKKQPESQFSLFDLMTTETTEKEAENVEEDEDFSEEEKQEILEELYEEEKKKASVSPIYTKYNELQLKYKDCIVAYRLGDFYEIFGDNAKRVANEIDLTLTGRDFGLEERIPMVGFPYHAADNYFNRITKFARLAIYEQDDVKVMDIQKTQGFDEDTGEIFDLTEEEMREFDGDVEEPQDLLIDVKGDEAFTLITKSIDREIMLKLYEMLDGRLEIR